MKDFLPALADNTSPGNIGDVAEYGGYKNVLPVMLYGGRIGLCPRSQFTSLVTTENAPSASTDRGRGRVAFGGNNKLYLDEDTYFYNGGSQDLTATTGNGYAGNTGFNEEYIATFPKILISGVENMVIVNAGHTSTNASANHGNIWYVSDAVSAPSSISDADLPCNNGVSITRGGAALDGYFFIGDITGKIYNSNLNDITTWTATDFLTAEREPDVGIYLGKHHNTIVYIGTRSVEFFYNAANASGSPLSPRQDVSYSVGCYCPNSVVEVGDIIYFVGSDHTNWPRLFKIENFQLSPISTPLVENSLRDQINTDFILTALDALNHSTYLAYGYLMKSPGLFLTAGTNISFWYCLSTQSYHPIEYGASATYTGGLGAGYETTLPIVSCNYTTSEGSEDVTYQLTDGRNIREGASTTTALDDWAQSNDPDIHLIFPRWDAGTSAKKKIKSVRMLVHSIAKTGVSNEPFNVQLKWHDLDKTSSTGPVPATSYTGSKTININKAGARIYRCGTTRERSFMVDFTSAGQGAIAGVLGLEIDYEITGE